MTWSELLFAHWRFPSAEVARLLPKGVTLETWDGDAWVGVVPFLMSDVAPRGCPAVPGVGRFLELNVRTYATVNGKPGVWFFSLDAESRLAVRAARTLFHLPYMDASMSMEADEHAVTYQSHRTHRAEPSANFDATYERSGDWFHAQVGTLEHWLTARYCLYSVNRKGQVYRGEIDHPPWTLASADYQQRTNSMGQSLDLDFSPTPHLLVAKPVTVQTWNLNSVSQE
ncbi:MAG: DUF2071 domain-containing protein [Planctomycetota bacterium]